MTRTHSADLIVLAAEREFGHDGAVARIMSASDLVVVLPILTAEPWLPAGPVQQRMHLVIVEALMATMIVRRLIDRHELCGPMFDVRCAPDREHARLRFERRQTVAARMSSL